MQCVQRAIGLHRVTMLLMMVHASASDVRVKSFTTVVGLYHHWQYEERSGGDKGVGSMRIADAVTEGFLHNDDQGVSTSTPSSAIRSLMKCEMRITERAGAIGGGGNLPVKVLTLLFGPLPANDGCILLSFRQSFLFMNFLSL